MSTPTLETPQVLVCWAPLTFLGEPATADDPRYVETEIDILELVPQEQKGGAGKFHATPQRAAEMIRNHATEAALNYEPPMVLGHPRHEDGTPDESAKAVGWVTSLRRVGSRLRASVRLLKDFAEAVRKGEYRYVSPEFSFAAFSSTGQPIGSKVFRVGVTNTPHQKGADGHPVGEFQLSELALAQETPMTFDAEKACAELTQKVTDLTAKLGAFMKTKKDESADPPPPAPPTKEEEEAALAAKKLAEADRAAVVALSAKVDGLVKALTDAGDGTKALAAKDGEIKSLTERVGELETAATAAEIRKQVRIGLTEKQNLSPAQVEGHDKDPIKWLASTQFADVERLKKHVETAPKVVDAQPRTSLTESAGAQRTAGKVTLTDAQAKTAGYANAAEMQTALSAYDARHGAGSDEDDASAA